MRLGLSWDETQFQDLRALRIYNVMRRKKFLLLLDDVWEGLDLEKIGIPIPSKENRSKVIFTTRSLGACSYMDADYKLQVDFLNEKDSWMLFHKKLGASEILDVPVISALAKTMLENVEAIRLL